MSEIKQKRIEAAKEYNIIRSSLTNLTYNDMLKSAEANKSASIMSLKRKEL